MKNQLPLLTSPNTQDPHSETQTFRVAARGLKAMVGLYAAPTTVYIVFKSVSYKAASLALRGYSFDALLCSIMDVNLFIRLCPFFLQNFLYLENKWTSSGQGNIFSVSYAEIFLHANS